MKTDLEVEVEVDLRPLGKVIIFRVKQNLPIIYRYIAYYIDLNLQICDYTQKRRICRDNCKYALDEHFHGHFCPRRNAAKFCHPACEFVFAMKTRYAKSELENW